MHISMAQIGIESHIRKTRRGEREEVTWKWLFMKSRQAASEYAIMWIQKMTVNTAEANESRVI